MNQESFLIFLIQNQYYALSLQSIHEITSLAHLNVFPRPVGQCVGITHQKNQLLSVLYLDKIDEDPLLDKKKRLIILQFNTRHFALLVDEVLHIEKVNDEDVLRSLTQFKKPPLIEGLIQKERTQYWILSIEKLFHLL